MKNWKKPEVGSDSLTAAGEQPESTQTLTPESPVLSRTAAQPLKAAGKTVKKTGRAMDIVPVVISPYEQPPHGVSPTEYSSLCCLLDRADYYGGEGDVIFLCLRKGLLLARFLPAEEALCACGYLFNSDTQVPDAVIWDRLPALIGLLLRQDVPDKLFAPDFAAEESAALKRFRHDEPALWSALRRMERDCVLDIQPKSVGFTRLPSRVYGSCGIKWYPITPPRTAEENTVELSSDAALLKQFDADSRVYLTPPSMLRGWRITENGKKRRADGLSDEIEWPKLQQLMEDLL